MNNIKYVSKLISGEDLYYLKDVEARDAISDLETDLSETELVVAEAITDINNKVTNLGSVLDIGYGIAWTSSNTTPYRIGNPDLHKSLPIQSQMRRCIKNANGIKYISQTDYTKYEDNTTVNYQTDGDLMVHIPKYWYKASTELNNGTSVYSITIYTNPVPGAKESKEVFVGAVEASSNDASSPSTPMLYSIVKANITYQLDGSVSATGMTYASDASSYRGGNARTNATDDSTLKSLLGRPVTSLKRSDFRTRAKNRGTGYSQQYWDAYMSWVRLYVVEYCNFNTQAAYNSAKTADGYMQGGLGNGVSTISSNDWNTFNGYNPFVPCGVTLKLGNTTGTVTYTNDTFTVDVPSYRGIENPFGHIWKFTDGINCYGNESTKDFYTCNDITKFADDTSTNYTYRGSSQYLSSGWIKNWIQDENADFLPLSSGGSSSSYLYDYSWLDNTGWRVLFSGGFAFNGAHCGLFAFAAPYPSLTASANYGGRLYFTPQEN